MNKQILQRKTEFIWCAIKIRTLCAVNVDRNPVSDRNSSQSARKPNSRVYTVFLRSVQRRERFSLALFRAGSKPIVLQRCVLLVLIHLLCDEPFTFSHIQLGTLGGPHGRWRGGPPSSTYWPVAAGHTIPIAHWFGPSVKMVRPLLVNDT